MVCLLNTHINNRLLFKNNSKAKKEKKFQKIKLKRRVILNVGGIRHEVLWKTLEKLPNSRLGKIRYAKTLDEIRKLCDDIDPIENEIFFDRHSNSFSSVLNFYRTGKLHLIDDICILSFHDDLYYWGIDEYFFESCCHLKYHQRKEAVLEEMKREEESTKEKISNEKFSGFFPEYRKKVWDLMEKPETSRGAQIIAFVSIFFVVLSSISLTLNTIPELQVKVYHNITKRFVNNLFSNGESSDMTPTNGSFTYEDNPIFERIESLCIGWFTIELLIRFISSPHKLKFIRNTLNIIDFFSVIPYYISLMFDVRIYANLNNTKRILTLFKVLRILRIFKLARHFTGLKSLGYTMSESKREIGLLTMFLVIAVLLFSNLAYYAEKDEKNTQFTSIPATFWWAFITITTVGYGDMVPVTFIGKVVAVIGCLYGVLVIALPIPIIINNFSKFYREQIRREKIRVYKEKYQAMHQNKLKEFEMNQLTRLENIVEKTCNNNLNKIKTQADRVNMYIDGEDDLLSLSVESNI